jgi:hypothetical protein
VASVICPGGDRDSTVDARPGGVWHAYRKSGIHPAQARG